MNQDTDHELIYDYTSDAISPRCRCGGWAWDMARNAGLLPLQVFTAIQAEHRHHVGNAARRDDGPGS